MIWQLLWSFIKVGAFSFGGGYAAITFIQKEIIDLHGWLTGPEFVDMVAIAEMTPGPVAINTATFVGYRVAGVLGSAAATVGVIAVPVTLSLLVTRFFTRFSHLEPVQRALKGVRPAVLGLIAAACFTIGRVSIVDLRSALIGLVIFVAAYRFKVNPILCVVFSGLLGFVLYGLS